MTTTDNSEPVSELKAVKTEIRRSPDFRSIYANWVQTQFSPHEVSFLLGEAFQSSPEVVEVEQKARLILGPLEAKLVMFILAKMVSGYESQFGTINIPERIVREMAAQVPELLELIEKKTEGE
jgi:hypothetical protein